MYHRLFFLAVATSGVFLPLAADWQEGWDIPFCTPPLFQNCESRLFAEVDYLLWFADQQGSSPSVNLTVSTPPGNNPLFPTIQQDDNFFPHNWNSGVRAIVGYKPQERSWDFSVIYLNFTSKTKRNRGPLSSTYSLGNQGDLVFGNFFNNTELSNLYANEITKNYSNYRLNLNQVDLEFGQAFNIAGKVVFRPFVGARGLWANQRFYILENQQITMSSGPLELNIINLDALCRFNGFGARAGFETEWNLFWNLDLYGSLAGGIIWGRAKVIQSITDLQPLFGGPSNTVDLFNSHQMSVLNLDAAIGLQWSEWFDCGRSRLFAKFGWENHIYTNMNQIQNMYLIFFGGQASFDRNIGRGDLSLSGFVFSLGYLY